MNLKRGSKSCHEPFCITVFIVKLYHFVIFYCLGKLAAKVNSPESYNFAHPGMLKCQGNQQEQILHNRYAFVEFAVMKTESALVIIGKIYVIQHIIKKCCFIIKTNNKILTWYVFSDISIYTVIAFVTRFKIKSV